MMREALLHPLRFAVDHRFTRAQASNYLDEDLDGGGRARVERHADVCPPCKRFLASLRRTVSALGTLRGDERPSPAGVSEGVLARLREEPDRAASSDTG